MPRTPQPVPDPSTLDLDLAPKIAAAEALWTLADLAGMLRRSERKTLYYLAAWEDTPDPLFHDGAGPVWSHVDWWQWAAARSTVKSKHRVDGLAFPERLWTVADVAKMLRRCDNTTRKYIEEWKDTPAPLFNDGAGAVWDPRDWWAWAEKRRIAAAAKRSAERCKAKGRKTRV
jgi:hypothetical protein